MTNRKKIAAGNWKMHKTFAEGQGLAQEIRTMSETELMNDAQLLIFPPYIHLQGLAKQLEGSKIGIGAQNINQFEQGAYTGEVSASMLKSIGIHYTLVGHSERRQYYNETNESCAAKISIALKHNIVPVYCIGETLAEREANEHFNIVETQLGALKGLSTEDISKCILAYEPVWAIGTGVTASSAQANEMHVHIRKVISDLFNENIAQGISILYGGSVKPDNAKELFAQSDIDGALIGGAALASRDFINIAKSF
ncbi:MAG: triose-phosphate isomerase [bacterium]|nr:triose-phosphate isomerase [bacterium]